MKRLLLPILVALLAPSAVRAQPAYLVKDLNTTSTASPTSSSPYGFFKFGSRIYFGATTPGNGAELWSTDGTAAGTAQVADINRGSASSFPNRFVVVNGKLLFNARDSRGEELWTTDGTSAGTRLLADINNGSASSFPGDRILYRDQLIFAADDGVDGTELWITDGTPGGTRFLKDLAPGGADSNPQSFVLFNDAVYFAAAGELWKTDGTESGTVLVSGAASFSDLVVAGHKLFITGYTAETGEELWASDGTAAGTRMVTEIMPGKESGVWFLARKMPFDDRIFFVGHDPAHGYELWISDGTAAGTHLVRDINPGVADSVSFLDLAIVGTTAFFYANDGSTGPELWKTDGTEAGTSLVRDVMPGPAGSGPRGLIAVGGSVFFAAAGSLTLWRTDGSAAGTREIHTSESASVAVGASSQVQTTILTEIDGRLYFAARNALNGYEPWKSDGTDEGTSMIANLAKDAAPSSAPANLTAADDWIYFDAWDGVGTTTNDGEPRSLWRSDGTPEGTLRLTNFSGGSTPVGRSIFFSNGGVLWMSDGTPEGTAPATEFTRRFPTTPIPGFVLGDKIFVSVYGSSQYDLWTTTIAPNAPVLKLGVGGRLVNVAGRAMFLGPGASPFDGTRLSITDGTPEGTKTVVANLGQTFDGDAVVMGGHLYFGTRSNDGSNPKLWKSDGTFEGTVVVKSLPAGVNHMTAAGKTLFFVTSDQKLWATDGTEAGTRSLPAAPLDGVLAAAGDRVVFSATDTTNGQELWGSDGTIAGTHLLRDIYPGTIGSTPSELVSAEGMVYFRAFDDLHGSELWMTDGTSAGTTLAADVEPGLTSSFPRQFVRAGERLFFTATTAATGNELWALPLPPTPRLSINDIRVAEGQSGLTAAHFVVTVSPAPTTAVIVQYATSDGTGIAGRDYDAVSGALTFGPGETTKNIDVSVHGNVDPENNRTFFVTLLNATRATLAKSTGFAIIEDDDQIADLALTLDFSQFNNLDVLTNATNNGPRTATNITIRGTATPATVAASTCSPCPRLAQLAPGATAAAFDYRWFGFQQYLTATATIAQRDPQPSNNVVAWITNNNLAMDALYLTPGSQANVWYSGSTAGATVSIESSNPAILSVPSSLTTSAAGKPLSFVARAVSVGTATIRLFTPTATVGTLTVDVFPAGTKPRWPGALNVFAENSPVPFDTQSNVNIYLAATAPYTGETASGQVTIAANGREVAHVTLPSGIGLLRVPYYLPEIGSNPITVSYPGDANFLPMTVTTTVTSSRGTATLLGGAERNSTNARIHVRLAGSPMAAPTGTVTLTEAGTTTSAQISISATGGIAQGEITLSNISAGAHTFVLAYSGDARYFPSSQSVRLAEARGRSVRR